MTNLLRCTDCGSFAAARVCPHCASERVGATRLGALATLLGSSAFAMTLMACYGEPYNSRFAPDYTGPTYRDPQPDGGRPTRLDGGAVDGGSALDAGKQDAAAGDASLDAAQHDAGEDASSADAGAPEDASTADAAPARDAS